MLKIRILSASKYNVKDADTGDVNTGVSIQYQTPGTNTNKNRVGDEVVKGSLPVEFWPQFEAQSYPCDADASFSLSTSNNRSVIKLTGIKFAAK